jgi:hypothetical protein
MRYEVPRLRQTISAETILPRMSTLPLAAGLLPNETTKGKRQMIRKLVFYAFIMAGLFSCVVLALWLTYTYWVGAIEV